MKKKTAMKKLILALALTSALFSCKKETTNPTNSKTNNPTTSVVCVDNPNINFTAIGTPVGKFSDCIKDVDGNIYKTVTIGTQTWMAENLKTSKYNDGISIPNVKDNVEWYKLSTGAWAYYDNDTTKNAKYGKLYNWYAVSKTSNGNKNVCPTGWHLPFNSEWMVLIDYLGGESVAGGKLKEVGTTSWDSPKTDATNTSLFSALPGGFLPYDQYFECVCYLGFWWSSSEFDADGACYHYLDYKKKYSAGSGSKGNGLSVRCLKD